MRDCHLRSCAFVAIGFFTACAGAAPPTGARLEVKVAPLDLPDIGNAQYTIVVANADTDVVWTATVTSDRFGDGVGSIAYVGTCDASSNPHTATLTLDKLWDTESHLLESPEDYRDPGPITLGDIVCRENADVAVVFDLTLMRAAEQGFFDVAVDFEDVFCSAKVDCVDELLHDGDTRGPTVVLGLACTAGGSRTGPEPSRMYFGDLTLSCVDPGGSLPPIGVTLHPGDVTRPGLQAPVPGLLYQWAEYHGQEGFLDVDKCYWNHAFGLDVDAIGDRVCTLSGAATASNRELPGGVIDPDVVWPVISFSVEVLSADGALCGNHPLDGGAGGVTTGYVKPDTMPRPAAFTAVYPCGASPGPVPTGCATDDQAPVCFPPVAATLACDQVPADLDPSDTERLQALFGMATANDNCPGVTVEELPALGELGCTSAITRRFRARDAAGRVSTNACEQTIGQLADTVPPAISTDPLEPICYFGAAGGTAPASIPFRVDEPCGPTLSVAYDEGRNGTSVALPSSAIGGTTPDHVVSGSFPLGTHALVVSAGDMCGNTSDLTIPFSVVDCKPPTVMCKNGLSVNIQQTGFVTLFDTDFLEDSSDNITPAGELVHALRRSDGSTTFPVDINGAPITELQFGCNDLGMQPVQLWAMDAAGNADYCETFVIVQDNQGGC